MESSSHFLYSSTFLKASFICLKNYNSIGIMAREYEVSYTVMQIYVVKHKEYILWVI